MDSTSKRQQRPLKVDNLNFSTSKYSISKKHNTRKVKDITEGKAQRDYSYKQK
jgi:hypothetical protein